MLRNNLLGVIFDLDNTLVSSSLNFKSIKANLGCENEFELLDFVDALTPKKKVDANKLLVKYDTIDALDAKKLAGTDELLAVLSKLNIPCAIVTRNCHQAALLKIQKNNIHIPTLLTREDHKAKPAPDALLHVAEHWKKSPENLLYVGDYRYDLQAAQNANTMSCLITYGRKMSYANLADIRVNDLIELRKVVEQVFSVKDI